MELLKEVTIFGLNFLKAKKGLKISEKEIETAKKVFTAAVKGVNITADFINKKKLAEPILDNSFSIIKTLFVISIITFLVTFSVLLFAETSTGLITIFIVVLICKVLLIASLILISILLLIFYAKLKNSN